MVIFIICHIGTIVSQSKTIDYSLLDNKINSGLAIPAEESFTLKGILPGDVVLVKTNVFRDRIKNNPDYSYQWKKPFDYKVKEFNIYVSDLLRGNEKYIFVFEFYRKASVAQIRTLQQAVHNNLEAYIDANYSIEKRGLVSLSARNVIKTNLSRIVIEGSGNFKHYLPNEFNGFSDIVGLKIDELHNMRLKNAKFNIIKTKKEVNVQAACGEKLLDELKALVKSEVDQYLNSDMLVLVEVKEVDAQTEKTINYLPINVGYSGVYFSGNNQNSDYGRSPYLGLSIPLANQTFKKFLGSSSLSAGFMLSNMSNQAGETVSGPVVGRPIYVALGYKMLKVMRFNAGAVLTSTETATAMGMMERIQVYPFVGISLEMNFWVGFNKR